MKKLISIMAAASMVASLSLTSFAATTTEVKIDETNKDNVTLTATDSGYTAGLAGTPTDTQYTIVVVKNDTAGNATITTNSIEYINQSTEQNFNFVLKSTPANGDKFTVFLGGDKTNKVTAGTIEAKEEAGSETLDFTVNSGLTGTNATKPYGIENGKIIRVSGLKETDVVTVTVDGTAHTAKYYKTPDNEVIHIVALVTDKTITNDMISHTTGTPEVIKFGDVDKNGTPAAKDASDLNRSLVGAVLRGKTYTLPTDLDSLLMCDTDGNGTIAAKDASDLNRSLVGSVLRGKTYSLETMGIYSIK